VKKYQTGRYYTAYFLTDEVNLITKAWLGNENFRKVGLQKQVQVLLLNTKEKHILKQANGDLVTSDGFEGNSLFFDRIDQQSYNLWRIPEYDLTYDLDNQSENEGKKRKGYRGSMLGVDRIWWRITRRSYLRHPANKKVLGMLLTFSSINDELSRSGVTINTKVQQGGPKKFRWGDVSKPNRNLPNLNMLNWFTHNSYIEIPMSQRMALYFDSRAQQGIADSVSNIGQMFTSTIGLAGIGGIIGGMMGGPLGGVFGAAAGRMGSRLLKPLLDEAAITSSRMNYWNGYWICLE